MSPITQLQLDAIDVAKALQNGSSQPLFCYVNIWDDQYSRMISGEGYAFRLPALFVAFEPGRSSTLGAGFTSYPEARLNLHIIGDQLDGGLDTMEQNLSIFALRDSVKAIFQHLNLTNCSSLQCCEDRMDQRHKNTYHYILSFVTNFIDSRGSMIDEDRGVVEYTLPNPAKHLLIDAEFVKHN